MTKAHIAQNKKSRIKLECVIKSASVFIEDGAFALFFRSLPLGILQPKSPHPWVFAIQGIKYSCSGGGGGGG